MVKDWQATVATLETIGPAIAYVGFSMGAIFGFPVVATMTGIQAAVFAVEDVRSTFDAIPGTKKELVLSEGDHNDWPPDLVAYSVTFLGQHLQAR